MSVTVDRQPLATEALGLRTVGQVLAHLQKDNRLVVHVLIDGREPDLGQLGVVRKSPLAGHVLFIETADPKQLAIDAIAEVADQLREAERLRAEASEMLRKGQNVRAMEKLSGCFGTWQHAQESVLKTAQLLRIELGSLRAGDATLPDLLAEFTTQLREIKRALENRDFVLLGDILAYEITRTSEQWLAALAALREMIAR